jgi:hypothetical protein
MKRKLIDLVAVACLVASLAVPAATQAVPAATPAVPAVTQEGARVIADGTLWLESPPEVRKAFIVGAGNMMALEATYAKKRGAPPPLAGTKAAMALEHMTLDEISDRITRWYEANPGRRATPVIGVLWMDMVEPGVARK